MGTNIYLLAGAILQVLLLNIALRRMAPFDRLEPPALSPADVLPTSGLYGLSVREFEILPWVNGQAPGRNRIHPGNQLLHSQKPHAEPFQETRCVQSVFRRLQGRVYSCRNIAWTRRPACHAQHATTSVTRTCLGALDAGDIIFPG